MSLGWLYSAVASAENDVKKYEEAIEKAEEKRDKAKKRRDAVKALLRDLKGDFDFNCNNINNRADKVKSEFEDGLKGLSSDIEDDKENHPESDTTLKESIESLEKEIEDLQEIYDDQKAAISDYKSEIRSLKSDIWSYNVQIWALEAAEELTDDE